MLMVVDSTGNTRVAYAEDFQDVTLTLTPEEFQDILDLYEYRKKVTPSVMAKSTKSIYEKLLSCKETMKLKDGLKPVKTEE